MNLMYKVKGAKVTFDVLTLDEAMHVAKIMNEFVTITGPDFEIVGMFGVDSIKNGKCPWCCLRLEQGITHWSCKERKSLICRQHL